MYRRRLNRQLTMKGINMVVNTSSLFTDTQLLDFMQSRLDMAEYTGKCIFRKSSSGRGWRLHETNQPNAVNDVRLAIDHAMIRTLKGTELP